MGSLSADGAIAVGRMVTALSAEVLAITSKLAVKTIELSPLETRVGRVISSAILTPVIDKAGRN
jgi:hypothetical protein